GALAAAGDAHEEGEDRAARALVQRVQRRLIAVRDGTHERYPVRLRDERLPLFGVQHVAQRRRRLGGVPVQLLNSVAVSPFAASLRSLTEARARVAALVRKVGLLPVGVIVEHERQLHLPGGNGGAADGAA